MRKIKLFMLFITVVSFCYSQDDLDEPIDVDALNDGFGNSSASPANNSMTTRSLPGSKVPGSFMILTDQDFFFVTPHTLNEDRNYTQGTVFTYSHPDLARSIIYAPISKIAGNWFGIPTDMTSLSVGATAFTPIKLDSINPVVGDRPFAFLFYIGTSSMFVKSKPNGVSIFNTISINYGMLGTNLGYEFQSFAHKKIVVGRPKDPKGWQHQISNGGAPTLLIDYNRFRPLISYDIEQKRVFDLGWNFGGSIGYYDRLYNGLYGRLGLLKAGNQSRWNSGWASLSSASYQMSDPTSNEPIESQGTSVEMFAYSKVNSTMMLRNSLLEGQRLFDSEYTLDPHWSRTAIFEFEYGLVISFQHAKSANVPPRNWAIMVRQVHRSPEFDSRIYPTRWHRYGSLGIVMAVR